MGKKKKKQSHRKDEVLKVCWSKREKDFVVYYPDSKATGGYILDHLLGRRLEMLLRESGKQFKLQEVTGVTWNPYMALFEKEDFRQEMERRGYDLTTLKFSIKKKKAG